MYRVGPDVVVGTREFIEHMRHAIDTWRACSSSDEWAALLDAPTHYVKTVDDRLGVGHSFADAFSDLVRQRP